MYKARTLISLAYIAYLVLFAMYVDQNLIARYCIEM